MSERQYSNFHTKVLPAVEFVIEGAGENGETRTFKLVLDFNAIAKIEDELGRDLKSLAQWKTKSATNPQGLSAKDITFICWAAFDRFHPDVTLRQLRSWIGPAHIDVLWLTLVEMCFPGIIAAIDEARKLQEEAGASGESQPITAS